MSIGRQAVRRIAARVGRIDQSGSPRLRQISFNRHFALATPCAHVPGCSAEPSNFKIGIAHPWSGAIGSSTSAAQRSLLFDVVAILPSKEGATRLAAESAARDFIADAVAHHMFSEYVDPAIPLLENVGAEPDGDFIRLNKPKDCSAFVTHCRTLRFWERTER
jgi:hypothetical protein